MMPLHRTFSRVRETSTTEGTATYVLAGPVTGFLAFSARLTAGQTVWYTATDGTQWETGIGTYQVSGSEQRLERTTIIENSAGTTSRIDWGPGTREVFCAPPGSRLATLDQADELSLAKVQFRTTGKNTAGLVYGSGEELGLYDETAAQWAWYWDWDYNGSGGKRLRVPQLLYADIVDSPDLRLNGASLGTAATATLHDMVTGTSQAASSTTVTLAAGESSVNDIYNDLEITMLTGPAAGQTREITDYVGSTKVLTVGTAFSPAPSSGGGDQYAITTGPAQADRVLRSRSDGRLDPRLVPRMGAATSSTDGTLGIPAAPRAGEEKEFLRGDNSWKLIGARFTDSSWITSWTNGSTSSVAHGLGDHPDQYWLEAECTTSEHGYAVGDRIVFGNFGEQGTSRGLTVWATSANVAYTIASAGIAIARRDATSIGVMTPSSWKIRRRAIRWRWDD